MRESTRSAFSMPAGTGDAQQRSIALNIESKQKQDLGVAS
jgi:hypothetical protein